MVFFFSRLCNGFKNKKKRLKAQRGYQWINIKVGLFGLMNLRVRFLDLIALSMPIVGVTQEIHDLLPQIQAVSSSYLHKTSACSEFLASNHVLPKVANGKITTNLANLIPD